MDVGTNFNEGIPHNQGVSCAETPDSILPNALRGRLNYSTGFLEIDVDETVDLTPASKLTLSSFFLSHVSGDDYVGLATLGGAFIRSYDYTTITLILTELQRADAVLKSGVPGGDGDALVLDVKANGLLDIAQNPNQGIDLGLTITETDDTLYPTIFNATLDLNDGTLVVHASETIDARLAANVKSELLILADATGKTDEKLSVRISDATLSTSRINYFVLTLSEEERVRAIALSGTPGGDANGCPHTPLNGGKMDFTLHINSQSITESQGVAISQNNGFSTTTLGIDSQFIAESQNVVVTQTNGYVTWTIQIASQNINVGAGVSVTQTSNSGIGSLSVPLTGAGMTSITFTSNIGQQFDLAADLVLDGGISIISSVVSSPTATTITHVAGLRPLVVGDVVTVSGHTDTMTGLAVIQSAASSSTSTVLSLVAAGARPIVVGDVVSVSGHIGDANNLAMNQVFTVAAVVSETSFTLTGTGMTPGTYTIGTIRASVGNSPSTLAMNQGFTVASVTSTTVAVLTGTGMTVGTYNSGTIVADVKETISSSKLQSISSVTTPHATGTLTAALTGAGMTSVVVRSNPGSTAFDTQTDLIVGSTPVLANNLKTSSVDVTEGATGTLKTALTGAGTVAVVVTSVIGSIAFDASHSANLIIGSSTVLSANFNSISTSDACVNGPLVLDATFGAAIDLSGNKNYDNLDLLVVETADTTLPNVLYSTLDLNNGIFVVHISETVDGTPGTRVDRTKFDVKDGYHVWTLGVTSASYTASAGASVTQGSRIGKLATSLTGSGTTNIVIHTALGVSLDVSTDVTIGGSLSVYAANINTAGMTTVNGAGHINLQDSSFYSVDRTNLTFTMTETQRIQAIRWSGTQGGDDVALSLDVAGGAFQDIAINDVALTSGILITEIADTIIPAISTIHMNWSTGVILLTGTETLEMPLTDPSKMTLHKVYTTETVEWTMTFASTSITATAGDAVTQNTGATIGVLKTSLSGNVNSAVITAAVGQTFDTTTPLIINAIVVAQSDLISATPVTTATSSINLAGAAVTGTGLAFAPISIILLEAQRAEGVIRTDSYVSDGTLFKLDVAVSSIFDVGLNSNAQILNTVVTEDPDIKQPFALSATLDYTHGLLTVITSEYIDSTPSSKVDRSKLYLSNAALGNDIVLTGSQVTSSIDYSETTILLTELQRVAAIAISGTPGGDGGATVLDLKFGAMVDLVQNPLTGERTVSVIEEADVGEPQVTSASFNFSTGIFKFQVNETVDLTPVNSGKIDLTKLFITNDTTFGGYETRTITINAATITESQGVNVYQTNGYRTWTTTINAATLTENQGAVVSQANGYVTTTMTINSATISEIQSVTVTQANGYMTWTLTINSATITEAQGVAVTQGIATGT
jgi:hypothetical protein